MRVFSHIRPFLPNTYWLNRFLGAIISLFLISISAFFLSYQHPDRVARQVCTPPLDSGIDPSVYASGQKCLARNLGRNLPPFYLALSTWAEPDTLYRIQDPAIRQATDWLLFQYGNWEYIEPYLASLQKWQRIDSLAIAGKLLRHPWQTPQYHRYLDSLHLHHSSDSPFWQAYEESRFRHERMLANASRWKIYFPRLVIHGLENHYHHWLHTLITKGQMGIAYSRLKLRHCNCMVEQEALPGIRLQNEVLRSAALGLAAMVVVFGLGIPLGLLTAYVKDTWIDKFSAGLFFGLDAIPVFWTASAFLVFLGLYEYQQRDTLLQEMGISANREVWLWALIAYSYGSLAFVSRLVRMRLLEELNQDYLRTARAKGLNKWRMLWKHGLRNALLPLVTVMATTFPILVSGSVVIEKVFDYPGVGMKILEAIQQHDWPLMVSAVFLSGLLTVGGYALTDWLYSRLDPRVKWK